MELNEIGGAASYMIPIYGTYKSVQDAVNNPTWSNIGMAGLSAIGDIGMIVGAGGLAKGAVSAAKAVKAASTLSKAARVSKPARAAAVMNTQVAANKAASTYKVAQKMAVPVKQWAENQVYLQSLGQQASKAANAANRAAQRFYKAESLTKKPKLSKVVRNTNWGSPAIHAFNVGFKPAVLSANQLSK